MSTERHLLTTILGQKKSVAIICGTGGVGKTTTSAAIAIALAQKGKRVLVITIDPAKRLATSLGVETLHNEPKNLTSEVKKVWSELSTESFEGEFFALMPETNKTFERFVKTIASGEQSIIQRILSTTIYKVFAQDFSGMNEYLAMEKLHDLYNSKKFDVIVLDTPPSTNTLEFLNAPLRLLEFFDDRIVKWFIQPSNKLVSFGLKKVLNVLSKLTGESFITELLSFISALFELRVRFIDNLNSVQRLLKGTDVAFFSVSTPERVESLDLQNFLNYLNREKYPFYGIFLNRSLCKSLKLSRYEEFENSVQEFLNSTSDASDLKKLMKNLNPIGTRLRSEFQGIDFVKKSEYPFELICESSSDIYSIESLSKVAKDLL